MKTLRWFGLALQIVGVVIAAVGLRMTWRDYGAGRSFWAPVIGQIRRGWAWAKERALRLWARLGGRRSATVHAGTATGTVGIITVSATGRVGWAPPPDIEADPAGFAREMIRRADLLHETNQSLHERLVAEQKAHAGAVDALRAEISSTASASERMTRDVAVGGIQLEAFGVFLVAAGIVMQGIDLTVSPD